VGRREALVVADRYYAMAGWRAPVPNHPLTLDDGDHGAWNPVERLKRMNEYGLYAQVLYPNVIAFNGGAFMELGPELGLACTQAYNDFLTEFASADRHRLLPLMVLPFWDLDARAIFGRRSPLGPHRAELRRARSRARPQSAPRQRCCSVPCRRNVSAR
jgi:hypothetical protein